MVSLLVTLAAETGIQSEPPSKAVIVVWLAMFVVFLWGAHATHSMWAGTWILPGAMSDLPTLKRIYRWFGLFLLLLAAGVSIVALIEHHHHGTPTI